MMTLRVGVLVLVAVLGCKKDSSIDQALPVELKPKPAIVDSSKLKAPALFAHIPADSPYVIGSFEAVPLDYYAKMKRALGPSVDQMLRQLRALAEDDGKPSVLDAILDELDGKLTSQGLESLGFSATPRFAIYGLGLLPVVFRLEVKDHKAVQATIERVAKKGGATLPATATRDGRDYWRVPSRELDVVVALGDNQLVIAIGPAASIDQSLPLILGTEQPPQNMADGKALADLMSKHGFGPHLVGFADTKRIAMQAFTLAGVQPSAACTTEIDRLASNIPRIVMGYSEISTKRASGGAVIELSQAWIDELKALKTEVPALGAALSDEPLVAMGGGLDLARAYRHGQSLVSMLNRLGEACDSAKLRETAEHLGTAIMRPLPEPIAKITGGVIAIQDISFSAKSRKGIPDSVEAFALLASTDAKGLVEAAMDLAPALSALGLETDGKLHEVGGGMLPIPFAVLAGVGDRAVVLAIGDKGKRLANKAIDAPGNSKVPFFVMSYDYGKFLALRARMPDAFGADEPAIDQDVNRRLSELFGRAGASVDINDKGLVMWGTIEMK